MSDEMPARVTINMLYSQQLENEKILIEMSQRLQNMEQLPERVRELELANAKTQWIEKVAYAGLIAGVGALISGVMNMI